MPAIQAKGVRLGISTHSDEELAIALAAKPDYVALGPIYETRLKVMKWAPQGLDRIADWKTRIGGLPLVAIGGITPERADGVVGGRRRQRCRHYRFLHPCRSDGARARMARLGARPPFSAAVKTRVAFGDGIGLITGSDHWQHGMSTRGA